MMDHFLTIISQLLFHLDSGAVKKMLHAPTLRLYAVKEEPVSTKEVRHCLRDWAVFW